MLRSNLLLFQPPCPWSTRPCPNIHPLKSGVLFYFIFFKSPEGGQRMKGKSRYCRWSLPVGLPPVSSSAFIFIGTLFLFLLWQSIAVTCATRFRKKCFSFKLFDIENFDIYCKILSSRDNTGIFSRPANIVNIWCKKKPKQTVETIWRACYCMLIYFWGAKKLCRTTTGF